MRVKPLSHQGGVLSVIPRCPKKKNAECRGARSTNASITAAMQWHCHWTRWGRIERRATVRTLSILKTNTVNRRPNRAQRGRRKVTIAAQFGLLQRNRSSVGAHKGRCANAVVVRGVCTETARRSWRCHWVFNTASAQWQLRESAAHAL